MAQSRLIPLEYYDQKASVRLSAYADTIVFDTVNGKSVIAAIRFGGYPEMVRGLSDAIYAGATIEATVRGRSQLMQCKPKCYERQLAHEGVYATATLMVNGEEIQHAHSKPCNRTGRLPRPKEHLRGTGNAGIRRRIGVHAAYSERTG